MNSFLMASLTTIAVGTAVAVKADTVDARCDIYPAGQDRATSSGLCTYSQRQGFVGIQLPDGRRYDLEPSGDQPDSYVDQAGQAVRRDNEGLGNRGVIYRFSNESIYVYWDPAPYGSSSTSPASRQSSPAPAPSISAAEEPVAPQRTYMTPKNDNEIAVQINDGEFLFRGVLTRSSGNTYIAEDSQVRVIYDREAGRVVVINAVTGTEFYNYPYRDSQRNTSEGSL
ncbi:MAG: hypothetical protein ACKO7W_07885 [Elainella sp.]